MIALIARGSRCSPWSPINLIGQTTALGEVRPAALDRLRLTNVLSRARTSRSCVCQEFVYSSRGSVIRSIHTLGSVQRLRVAVHSSRGTFVDVGNDVAGGSKVEVFFDAMSLREPNLCAYTHVNSAPSKKIWAE